MDSYIDWINLLRPRGLPANWNPTKWSPCRADSNIISGLQSNYQGRKYSNIRFSNDKLWFDVFSFIIHSKNYKMQKRWNNRSVNMFDCYYTPLHI